MISWSQLRSCGVTRGMSARWRAEGRLHLVHRGVYALGHAAFPIEGRLVAALLYTGPDAVLSHATALWWWELVPDLSSSIEVSAPGRASSVPEVLVHRRRCFERTRHRRFPVTTPAQTVVDCAEGATNERLRRILAEAEYRGLLDVTRIAAMLGKGRPGSVKLRRALDHHQPRLALTRSPLEEAFLPLCETGGVPAPEVNARIHRATVDLLWRPQKLVVELDGYHNHRTPAQLRRDRSIELRLRRAGFLVIRYSWAQVMRQPEVVVEDLGEVLKERTPDELKPPARLAGPGSR